MRADWCRAAATRAKTEWSTGAKRHARQTRGTDVIYDAHRSGKRCVVVTHGNLLALILRSIDATVGFDTWSQLSNPDVFLLYADGARPTGFRRIWDREVV